MKLITGAPFIILLINILLNTACSSDGGKNNNAKTPEKSIPAKPTVKVSFADDKIKTVYDHYIQLKNVLVKSDANAAKTAAASLQTALTAAESPKGADLAGKIAQTAELGTQRAEFNALTAEVEGTIRSGKISEGKIFKQYCPMANDGNGGYWLSAESEIRNPYYGDEMLECGEVKEEIQ